MSPAKPEMVNRAKKTLTGRRVMEGDRLLLEFGGGRGFLAAAAGPSRPVSGDGAFVDVVDLVRVEELARVAQVNAVAHEDVEEVGIDVPVLLHAPEDRERLGERLAFLVGAVARRER